MRSGKARRREQLGESHVIWPFLQDQEGRCKARPTSNTQSERMQLDLVRPRCTDSDTVALTSCFETSSVKMTYDSVYSTHTNKIEHKEKQQEQEQE